MYLDEILAAFDEGKMGVTEAIEQLEYDCDPQHIATRLLAAHAANGELKETIRKLESDITPTNALKVDRLHLKWVKRNALRIYRVCSDLDPTALCRDSNPAWITDIERAAIASVRAKSILDILDEYDVGDPDSLEGMES